AAFAARGADPVAIELVLEYFDFVVEGHAQTRQEIAGFDFLLDAVRAAVKAALAPARKIEHRLAQRLRRNSAGGHRHTAAPTALFHHREGFADLGRLDRGPPSGGPAPNHNHVVVVHAVAVSGEVRAEGS